MCFNWQRNIIFVSINSKWNLHWIISHFDLLNLLHQKVSKFTYNVFKWFPYVAIALDTSEISLAYFIVGIDKNTYETMQWHYWLAHLNIVSMKKIQKNSIMPTILNFINFPHFESCIMDKYHKDIFSPNSNEIACHVTILNLVHFNICKLIQFFFLGVKNILFPSLMTIWDMPMYIISNINIHEAFTISSIQGLVVKKMTKSSNCYAH